MALIALLTFCSGCLDVIGLTTLGGAFTSVVTGNLILLGRALGTSADSTALHPGLAVLGYVLGVLIGSRIAGQPSKAGHGHGWPSRATAVLTVEFAVLASSNVAWIAAGAEPSPSAQLALLVAAALALGMQSAAARAVDGSPSTTYMTGALTAVVEAVATLRLGRVDRAAVASLAALVAGAAVGAALVRHARIVAPLPPLVAIGAVVAAKHWDHHRERALARAASPRPGRVSRPWRASFQAANTVRSPPRWDCKLT
jgi:uncharacterized membrane protein YoaK (UPF0700 family)